MMHNENTPYLILASRSPRRKSLLEQAGLSFAVVQSDFDEDSVPPCRPERYVRTLARAKAEAIAALHPDAWIIGADTIVCVDGVILGKPRSREDARGMLRRLSGRTHQVITGYALVHRASENCITDAVKTEVRFKPLKTEEIEWYLDTGEPFDKAGAYAIQGLGTFLVKAIEGSYTNVVGLPVCEIIDRLEREGIIRPGSDGRWTPAMLSETLHLAENDKNRRRQ
ncbi:MAG: Maf family protein [Deltaproteobacteria bacterium]|nr:Maf family protein [Deltaproteobacteria bacterium]